MESATIAHFDISFPVLASIKLWLFGRWLLLRSPIYVQSHPLPWTTDQGGSLPLGVNWDLMIKHHFLYSISLYRLQHKFLYQ